MTKRAILFAKKQPSVFFDDFGRADGGLGNDWVSPTWAIASGKALNTPTLGNDLITNGNFAADVNWNKGANWTISGGVAAHTASGGIDTISQLVLAAKNWYRCDWTIVALTAGALNTRFGGSTILGPSRTAAAAYVDTRRADNTTAAIRANITGAGSIDNVSFKALTLSTLFALRNIGAGGEVHAQWAGITGTQWGVALCVDDPANPQNFVIAYQDGNNFLVMAKCVNGVYTELISVSTTWIDGHSIKLKRIPGTNTFQLFQGVAGSELQVGANQTITDPSIVGNVFGGLFSTYSGNLCDNFACNTQFSDPGWTKFGTVLSAAVSFEQSNVYEPNVIYEGNAQILTGNVFKMWYTAGWGTPCLNYAESLDGVTWTKYASNPIIATHYRSFVFKDGSTYHLYAALQGHQQIDHYTSSDGVAWTLVNAAVLAVGIAGAWDDNAIANCFVWKESANDWRMLYEGKRSGTGWHIGYATSTDGVTWAKSASNPVLTDGSSGGQGGPWVTKIGGVYYLWLHRSLGGVNVLPTDIYRYTSFDLITWTTAPNYPRLFRVGSDEGAASAVGQAADPFIVTQNGLMYLFYSGSSDGTQQTGAQHIKLVVADLVGLIG